MFDFFANVLGESVATIVHILSHRLLITKYNLFSNVRVNRALTLFLVHFTFIPNLLLENREQPCGYHISEIQTNNFVSLNSFDAMSEVLV